MRCKSSLRRGPQVKCKTIGNVDRVHVEEARGVYEVESSSILMEGPMGGGAMASASSSGSVVQGDTNSVRMVGAKA